MAKRLSKEQRLAEYLDQILAGKEISVSESDRDLIPDLEFARKILGSRDEPSPDFRLSLKNRLLSKIARGEVAKEEEPGFWEKLRSFGSNMQAIRIATGVALVLVVIVGGTIWYRLSGRDLTTVSVPTPAMQEAGDMKYIADLPQSNVPADVVVALSVPLSSGPAQAETFRVSVPHVTSSKVRELGDKLGFSGEAVYENNGERIAMYDGSGIDSRKLNVWVASGAVEYGYTAPDKLYPSEVYSLPSMDEAKEIAYGFLKDIELLPPGYQSFTGIRDNIIVVSGNDPSPEMAMGTDYWRVIFPYGTPEGIQFDGPGARLEVTVGDGGDILRILWAWREMVPFIDQQVISEEAAYEALISGKGSIIVPSETARLDIYGVDLVYWIDNYNEAQEYVVPVYRFKGESVDKDGRHLEDVSAWVNAVY